MDEDLALQPLALLSGEEGCARYLSSEKQALIPDGKGGDEERRRRQVEMSYSLLSVGAHSPKEGIRC